MVPPDETDVLVIEALAEHVAELNTKADGLRHEVERRVKRQTWLLVVVSALATVLFAINLVFMVQLLHTSHNAAASRKAAEENTAQIKDCITPTGKCFKDSNARTGGLISNLINSIDQDESKTQELIREVAQAVGVKLPK